MLKSYFQFYPGRQLINLQWRPYHLHLVVSKIFTISSFVGSWSNAAIVTKKSSSFPFGFAGLPSHFPFFTYLRQACGIFLGEKYFLLRLRPVFFFRPPGNNIHPQHIKYFILYRVKMRCSLSLGQAGLLKYGQVTVPYLYQKFFTSVCLS